jgi:omega-3 fatty acid desaturase (delta-15 desaturase)
MATLILFGIRYSFLDVLIYYSAPYLVFSTWLVVVTFLHHSEENTTWYSNENWNYVKGNLVSVDRNYGTLLESVHHNIGTHVVHHLFPKIPHYNLRGASAALRKVLGKDQRSSSEPIWSAFWTKWRMYSTEGIGIDDDAVLHHYKGNQQ